MFKYTQLQKPTNNYRILYFHFNLLLTHVIVSFKSAILFRIMCIEAVNKNIKIVAEVPATKDTWGGVYGTHLAEERLS